MSSGIEKPSRRTIAAGLAVSVLPLGAGRPEAAPPPSPAIEPTMVRDLIAGPQEVRFAVDAAQPAAAWLFDGARAGPVLRVRQGDELAVRLINQTPSPLSLHWHGVRGPNGMDGVGGLTQPPVAPGAAFVYRFVPPDPGTFLIRPLMPGRASEAGGRGLDGLLIVDERAPPPFDGDYVCLVRDWRIAASGALEPFGGREDAALAGRLGNRIDVAGAAAAKRIDVAPGARLRLRLANGSNARIMRIRFDGLKAFVAAVDGQPTENFQPLRDTLPFSPGTRYDLFVEAPATSGAVGAVTALLGPGVPLVEIATTGERVAASERPMPTLPLNPTLPPEIKLQNAVRREIAIAGGASRSASGDIVLPPATGPLWTMNGIAGSPTNLALFTAKRGQPVVLGLENRTGFPQPLHLHGHVFRLLHALDDGWEPYWLDTFQLPEGKTLHIAFLADNPGRWALSSTVLERFDTGLWTWFEVT